VYFRIGGVLKLLQAKSIGCGVNKLLALADGSCHALQASDSGKNLAYFMLHSQSDQAAWCNNMQQVCVESHRRLNDACLADTGHMYRMIAGKGQ
jgi:hypothetical protein